jgi:glycosyltransferase involved in cell wall biosynthesis
MSKESIFITFPVDLGNTTYESNLMELFSDKMNFFRFAPEHKGKKNGLYKSIFYRLKSTFKLRKEVRAVTKKGGKVIFHGISPALFSFGAWKPENVLLIVDWTRELYPAVLGEKRKKDFMFPIHQRLLKNCPKIACWTDAVRDNIVDIYKISPKQLFRLPAPFLLEKLSMPPRETSQLPKVLFIGGDWLRKGGDLMESSWQGSLKDKCELTVLTTNRTIKMEGAKVLHDIRYGTPEHWAIFEQNDILILPTRIDSYPQVIGEAAAAGLAVVTTKFALGATDVIIEGESGYIAQSPEESIILLEKLLDNPSKINQFKKTGYQHMLCTFSRSEIRKRYFEIIDL